MAKSKQQKEKAIEALKTLDHDARVEVLTQEGFSEKERAEVLDALAEYDLGKIVVDMQAENEAASPIEEVETVEEAEVVEETKDSETPTPAPVPAPVVEQSKAPEQPKVQSGHPRFEQVELYWSEGQLKEGTVIKVVSIEADRAERLNSQSRNTKIRYRPVK